MGRIFLAILCIVFLSAFSEKISDGIRDWRTDQIVDNEGVSTGAGVTTANVTLANDLYRDNPTYVLTITSNVTGDVPTANAYTSTGNVLTIGGLQASVTHTLTTTYYADIDDQYMAIIGPFLTFLIFGGILGAIVYMGYSGVRSIGGRRG